MKGIKGQNGDWGKFGLNGMRGSRGDEGEVGPIGFPGLKGRAGDVGEIGDPPDIEPQRMIKGSKGNDGLDGAIGLPGYPGPSGDRGPVGIPGDKGDEGLPGPIGRDGYKGLKGMMGETGIRGMQGLQGLPGILGSPGMIGQRGRMAHSRGYFYTKHSQSTRIPDCPTGSSKMWSGYSLLYIMGNERSHGQDLGTPGSCLRKFSTMPYMFCDIKESCHLASRNDYSYWLSTNEPTRYDKKPMTGEVLSKYISRCSVCETITSVIAFHSQTTEVPECPYNWESLWIGYSFFMNTDAGSEGSGQPLSSPGSCLEDFRPSPFIECQGHGRCNSYTTALSFWLASIELSEMFKTPEPVTLTQSYQLRSKISRCRVCRKIPIEIRRKNGGDNLVNNNYNSYESRTRFGPIRMNSNNYTRNNL